LRRATSATFAPAANPKALLVDKGYDGNRLRENMLMRGILPIIPPWSNRKTSVHPDHRRYMDRNCIERMFGKLKQQRRSVTRYDKTVLTFESFLNIPRFRRQTRTPGLLDLVDAKVSRHKVQNRNVQTIKQRRNHCQLLPDLVIREIIR
jgi:Transposase DDE domain